MTISTGDRVKWNSHAGQAEGEVVRVAHQDGEVSGFHNRASKEDPRYIVKLDNGTLAAHTESALTRVGK